MTVVLNNPNDVKHAKDCDCVVCVLPAIETAYPDQMFCNCSPFGHEPDCDNNSVRIEVVSDATFLVNDLIAFERFVDTGKGDVWDNEEQKFLESRRNNPGLREAYEWWISEVLHEQFIYEMAIYPEAHFNYYGEWI